MGLIIGMDEAGYGPNLGPLVVTVSVWEVPGDPATTDLWSALDDVVTQSRSKHDPRWHVADSKQVYSPSRGIGALERSVLGLLQRLGPRPTTLCELWRSVTEMSDSDFLAERSREPWFAETDPSLPLDEINLTDPHQSALDATWRRLNEDDGIHLRAIRSDIVLTDRFNRLCDDAGSKGIALSRISLRLLRQVWNPEDDQPTLVVADKHGGRNRYDDLIAETLDGRMIFRQQESAQISRYRVGRTELRFQCRAESHLPVAVASMVSKYVRETTMEAFNRFWSDRVPGLPPTKGYPVDARRFRVAISESFEELGLAKDVLWRRR